VQPGCRACWGSGAAVVLDRGQVRQRLGSARVSQVVPETAVEYARTREQSIGSFQLTQGKLAWILAIGPRRNCSPCTWGGLT